MKTKSAIIYSTLALVGLAFLVLARPATAASDNLVVLVCYPGGAVNERDAKPAMDSMLSVLESLGGWKPGTIQSVFTSQVKECNQHMGNKPHFAILSLGLFLEHRENHQLTPLVVPNMRGRTTETLRIVARRGEAKTLAELQGKSLGGTPLVEPAFLSRVVFGGKLDVTTYFKLDSSRSALRALRQLSQAKLAAVLLNDQQYQALGTLDFAKDLEVVFTSEALPLLGVAAAQGRTTEQQRQSMLRALTGMCTHAEGKKLCELFGIEEFAPAPKNGYDRPIALWNGTKTP